MGLIKVGQVILVSTGVQVITKLHTERHGITHYMIIHKSNPRNCWLILFHQLRIYCDTSPVAHLVSVYPGTHSQANASSWSSHVPLFSQGLLSHSFIPVKKVLSNFNTYYHKFICLCMKLD